MRRGLIVAVAVATAVALGVTPSALGTTNLVPNPGFESDCGVGNPPCNWSSAGAAAVVRDTTLKHSGLASIKVTLNASQLFDGAKSDCVNTPVSAGSHLGSGYYLTSDPTTNTVQPGFTFFSGANCTGTGTDAAFVITPVRNGDWQFFSDTITNVPAGTLSMRASLFVGAFMTGQTPTVYYDDLDFEAELLAVRLASFRAARSHRGVVVRWRTGSEVDTLGFNVFRQRGSGSRVRVNRRLLPAVGAVAGSSYSFTDRRAPRHSALRYWLQDVDTHGVRTWHGPVRVPAS
jgi:hypothetical protein